MHDAINESMFDFAMTCKYLMERGWEFTEINYGERRLGIGPSMKLRRGDVETTAFSPDDMEWMLRKEVDEEERKKWEVK